MIITANPNNKHMLFRHEKAGKLIRLGHGIYSNDLDTPPAEQVANNIVQILRYIRPGCVVSYRSALDPDFGVRDGTVYLTDSVMVRDYSVQEVGGVRFVSMPGNGPLHTDTRLDFGDQAEDDDAVFVSSKARAFLECLEPTRSGKILSGRMLPHDELVRRMMGEHHSSEYLGSLTLMMERVNDEADIKRDKELSIAKDILKTGLKHSDTIDEKRVKLFEHLAQSLMRGIHGNEIVNDQLLRLAGTETEKRDPLFMNRNLAFYTAYFSNYIEGTQFTPEEALDIIDGVNPNLSRPKDNHDIQALYGLYANRDTLLQADADQVTFVKNLKAWHLGFAGHEDKQSMLPGEFKKKANRAGNTWFVEPHLVEGTLKASWEIGRALKEPFDQAIYRALSTVVIHPFQDGNGRITRFAAANVLARASLPYFMIPNVFREDYILAMRAFSAGDTVPAIRVFKRAMEITLDIDWRRDWHQVTANIADMNGFCDPHEAKWGGRPPAKGDDNAHRFPL